MPGNRNGINKPSHSTLVYNVDEDIGERIQRPQERPEIDSESSDPLDSFSRPNYGSSRSGHNNSSSATRKGAGPSKRVPASDGPATRRLQARRAKTSPEAPTNYVDDSDDDPIESASGFSSPEPKTTRQSPQAPPGTVKEKRKLFESMSEQPKPPIRSQTSAKLSTDNVPRFNLETKTVKERMKPKAPPHVRPSLTYASFKS